MKKKASYIGKELLFRIGQVLIFTAAAQIGLLYNMDELISFFADLIR